jgi:hypothetical protein
MIGSIFFFYKEKMKLKISRKMIPIRFFEKIFLLAKRKNKNESEVNFVGDFISPPFSHVDQSKTSNFI